MECLFFDQVICTNIALIRKEMVSNHQKNAYIVSGEGTNGREHIPINQNKMEHPLLDQVICTNIASIRNKMV